MKIVKYLLLISLLLLLGFSVFVATLPADFKITKSKIINTPKSTLIAYVSDLRNWENFVFLESKETKYSFTKKNNLLSWQNQNDFGTIASVNSNEKNIYF